MENLKINLASLSLVDQVEAKLIEYFKEQGLQPGDSIPNENDLAASLGIGRTVLREALSRFKMTGMIKSRTKRGMVLAEPSFISVLKRCINPLLMGEEMIRNILEFRIVMGIGVSNLIFDRMTPEAIEQLENVVNTEEENGIYCYCETPFGFHEKIYELIGNKELTDFHNTIFPVLKYVMAKYREEIDEAVNQMKEKGELITHRDLLEYIKQGDCEGYKKAISKHLSIFNNYFSQK